MVGVALEEEPPPHPASTSPITTIATTGNGRRSGNAR
jgi:hypothetical protein